MSRLASRPSRPIVRPSIRSIPPLVPGDNLCGDEFLRRYEATPDGIKAELIGGVVYMAPPVSLGGHGGPHFKWVTILGIYEGSTPGVIGGDNSTLRLDLDDLPQPDVCLLIDPAMGGRASIDDDGYAIGGPELVAEVSATTVSFDSHQKLDLYRRAGIREYLIWRTSDREFSHYVLKGQHYVSRRIDRDGLLRSRIFPGLWIDTKALIDGNTNAAIATVQRGIASPEHAAFVAKLAKRAKKS